MPGGNMSELKVQDWMSMVNINIVGVLNSMAAVKTELLNTIAPSETKTMVEKFYEDAGLTPDIIANAVLYALSQPDNVNISDLVVRPSKEA